MVAIPRIRANPQYLSILMASDNKKEFYISATNGDIYLAEIFEHHGSVCLTIGTGFRIDLTVESSYDLVDALTMVANELDSYSEI